jgi:8-oxo-dGTP pyrophosphatase MutT (NUDIX family)
MAPHRVRYPGAMLPEGKDCRKAAELLLLYPRAGETTLALTVRQPTLREHSGQVSLPGGTIDTGETPEEAALREGWEEVGVPADHPVVIGRLTPIYIPPSNFCVQPVVAAVEAEFEFQAHEAEVAAMLHVPVAWLLDAGRRFVESREILGGLTEVPYFDIQGHHVWGATAMILAEFAAVAAEAIEPRLSSPPTNTPL